MIRTDSPEPEAPEAAARPKLAAWLPAHGHNFRTAAEALGVSSEAVRLWCLAFDDPNRRVPTPSLMERIVEWTGGEVTPADFYPQRLNAGPGQGAEMEPAR